MNTVNITAPQLVVTIDDASMLNKIKNAIKLLNGVGHISVVKPEKTELDLAREDKAKGRVTKWNSVDEMFETATLSTGSWVDHFAGKWQDHRTTSQILDDIHEARTGNPQK